MSQGIEKSMRAVLRSMQVRENKEDAQQKAYLIYNMGPEAMDLLVEFGTKIDKHTADPETKNLFRAVIFTLQVFYVKNKAGFLDAASHENAVRLLIDLAGLGFLSAKNFLASMGVTDADIHRQQLLALPEMEKLPHDRPISVSEACEEIHLSKHYTGFKGVLHDHYALGSDGKRVYKLCKIGKNLFALRDQKPNKPGAS